MKANEFVKNHGWKLVKDLIERGKDQTHVSNDSRMMIDAERYIREYPWFADDVDEMVSLVDLKRLVESYELVDELGGFEKAKLHLVATDKRLGYTHVYLHENGRYCWLDDYIDHIPFCAISIDSATKAITDVESVESLKEMT